MDIFYRHKLCICARKVSKCVDLIEFVIKGVMAQLPPPAESASEHYSYPYYYLGQT